MFLSCEPEPAAEVGREQLVLGEVFPTKDIGIWSPKDSGRYKISFSGDQVIWLFVVPLTPSISTKSALGRSRLKRLCGLPRNYGSCSTIRRCPEFLL